MSLSRVYDLVSESGSKFMSMIQSQPLVDQTVEYVRHHPWTMLGITTGAVVAYRMLSGPRNLPPGPYSLPFIGSPVCLQAGFEKELLKMRSQYGEVMCVNMFGSDVVILNSERVIKEAFVRRAEEFSHRRPSPFLIDIAFNKDETFSAPYNEEWKVNKKFGTVALKNSGFGTAKSETKIHRVIDKLVTMIIGQNSQPIKPHDYFKLMTTGLILSIFFNEEVPFDDPEVVKLADFLQSWMEDMSEGYVWYEFVLYNYPMLRWLFFSRLIKKLRKKTLELHNSMLEKVKEHRATFDKNDIRDIIDYYIAYKGETNDQTIAGTISQTIPDATESTIYIMNWVLFYIAYFQDCQDKMRGEIESAFGEENPSYARKEDVPFSEAFLVESVRVSNAIPFTMHRLMHKDTQFEGYILPKGYSVIACFHSVQKDPAIFPDPDKFDPYRFIKTDGKFDRTMAGRVTPFSLGPRMCMGEQYARSVILLTVFRLVQRFHLIFDPDQPKPSLEPQAGLSSLPNPHKICFIPRN